MRLQKKADVWGAKVKPKLWQRNEVLNYIKRVCGKCVRFSQERFCSSAHWLFNRSFSWVEPHTPQLFSVHLFQSFKYDHLERKKYTLLPKDTNKRQQLIFKEAPFYSAASAFSWKISRETMERKEWHQTADKRIPFRSGACAISVQNGGEKLNFAFNGGFLHSL